MYHSHLPPGTVQMFGGFVGEQQGQGEHRKAKLPAAFMMDGFGSLFASMSTKGCLLVCFSADFSHVVSIQCICQSVS